jgi:hypothetical protein
VRGCRHQRQHPRSLSRRENGGEARPGHDEARVHDRQACGGVDKARAGDRHEEDKLRSIGWPATCPNIEHGACTNTIDHCGDIATCIACVAGAAVDQAIDLVSDDLALPSGGG